MSNQSSGRISWNELNGNRYLRLPCQEMLNEYGISFDMRISNHNSLSCYFGEVIYDSDYVRTWFARLAERMGGIKTMKEIIDDLYEEEVVNSDSP
jgi:hypothetical protein